MSEQQITTATTEREEARIINARPQTPSPLKRRVNGTGHSLDNLTATKPQPIALPEPNGAHAASVKHSLPAPEQTPAAEAEATHIESPPWAQGPGGVLRGRLMRAVQRWHQRLLMPMVGVVGVTEDDQPVLFMPTHPRSGHAVFIFAQLDIARHYLDLALYSLVADDQYTPEVTLFVPPRHPVPEKAIFFQEYADKMAQNATRELADWAARVEQGQVPGDWRSLYLLVLDDLSAWNAQANADPKVHWAITTLLRHGLKQRVLVLATTTYDQWRTLPKAWKASFRQGFYGGLRELAQRKTADGQPAKTPTLAAWLERLDATFLDTPAWEAVLPIRGRTYIRFRSLLAAA